jgi:ATP-dependent Zn protease
VLFARHKGLRDTVDHRLQAAYARARSIVSANRAAVEAIAAHLVVDGHVDRDTLRDLLVFCRKQGPGMLA